MNHEQARSCVRFLESQRKKFYELLNTGDTTECMDADLRRRTNEEIEEAYEEAKELIAGGLSQNRALKQMRLDYRTYKRYYEKDPKNNR